MGEPEGYEDRYNRTDDAIARVQGLARALATLAEHHPHLSKGSPDNEAILALIDAIELKAATAKDLHEWEWDVIVKPRSLEPGTLH